MTDRYYSERRPHRSRWLSWLILCILVILGLLVLVFWLVAHFMMLPYSEFSHPTRIAQVHVIPAHIPHRMSIELTLFANDGHQISDTMYGLNGDEWRLEGDIITSPEALNFIGLYSGYKLTQLDSRYDPDASGSYATSPAMILNGGDDGFFKALYDNHTPVVQANKLYSIYLPADGKIYNIVVTQTGLSVEPSS